MSSTEARTAAPVFAALGDPTRLALLGKLSMGAARSIASLSDGAGLTRQAVTKHLHVLEAAGLVSRQRVGRESRYAFQPKSIDRARVYLDSVSAQWDDALGRLKVFAEKT